MTDDTQPLMTLTEFFQGWREAVKDKTATGWTVLVGHELRGAIRITGPRHSGDDGDCFCPLTLVAHQLTGTDRNITAYRKAGDDLGLPCGLAEAIAAAADGIGTGPNPDDPRYAIRRGLVEVLHELGLRQ